MKLGFGLYRHMLDREHLRFAKQAGATHIVVHLVDYFNQGGDGKDQPTTGGRGGGWGHAGDPEKLWSKEQLLQIKDLIESEGLVWHAIENFDPAHWHDVLLDGPKKRQQIEGLKQMIRAMGEVGIAVMGYNFSLAGVYGRTTGNYARGQAGGVGMEGFVDEEPMLDGMVWNMTFDENATGTAARTRISSDELWARLSYFLQELVPVAEEAGVMLAAHPDDPPVPRLRDTPRLVYQPDMYQRLLDIVPSKCSGLEYCLGTLAEMTEGDIYEATEQYAAQQKIGYVHFRNVRGKAPHYEEVFIDEGDIDMERIVAILKKHDFQGVLIPDHAPAMACSAPWYAGMAYSMGYMKALLGKADR
ncbi:mannonate dehydratase [Pelagicoccus sp. NFK12]|uniref:mannonate dehydratase n=1 Tax=Pelagicoccus enzymogenes TaxID=2773457 RepID=A0A927IGI8_9BACT|nr:mannonate dehydratase [Pelagicoccus enzymogenes]MBD5781242.1 mannonate dehydratase [Pelagicoccus enzymogenes]